MGPGADGIGDTDFKGIGTEEDGISGLSAEEVVGELGRWLGHAVDGPLQYCLAEGIQAVVEDMDVNFVETGAEGHPGRIDGSDTGIKEGSGKFIGADIGFDGIADLTGAPVEPPDLLGRVTVIDFWASWCGPCRQAFRYLDQLYRTYRGDGLQL